MKRDLPTRIQPVHAGLLRRLAAAAYDSLLVIAVFVIPTSAVMALRGGEPVPPGSLLFQALLVATAGAFLPVSGRMAGKQSACVRGNCKSKIATGMP